MRGPDTHPIVDDPAELKASVERLKSLGVGMVYPGHGKPFRPESCRQAASSLISSLSRPLRAGHGTGLPPGSGARDYRYRPEPQIQMICGSCKPAWDDQPDTEDSAIP